MLFYQWPLTPWPHNWHPCGAGHHHRSLQVFLHARVASSPLAATRQCWCWVGQPHVIFLWWTGLWRWRRLWVTIATLLIECLIKYVYPLIITDTCMNHMTCFKMKTLSGNSNIAHRMFDRVCIPSHYNRYEPHDMLQDEDFECLQHCSSNVW